MQPTLLLRLFLTLTSTLASTAHAHGSLTNDAQQPMQPSETDWASRHMAEEHHLQTYDAGSFFALHDFDNSGTWTADEIRRTYGLDDESLREVGEERKTGIVREVLGVFDEDGDGVVARGEWLGAWGRGKRLPDSGLGPGHHGDDEYEYEIHHFEKFHDENTKEEDLTHPEDIAHFKKHDQEADEDERQQRLNRMPIVEQNIPQKFRRTS